jgi:hypothetical protein
VSVDALPIHPLAMQARDAQASHAATAPNRGLTARTMSFSSPRLRRPAFRAASPESASRASEPSPAAASSHCWTLPVAARHSGPAAGNTSPESIRIKQPYA